MRKIFVLMYVFSFMFHSCASLDDSIYIAKGEENNYADYHVFIYLENKYIVYVQDNQLRIRKVALDETNQKLDYKDEKNIQAVDNVYLVNGKENVLTDDASLVSKNSFFVDGIYLINEYRIWSIGNILFVFHENIIYQIKFPISTENIGSLQMRNKINNVRNVYYFANNHFYINWYGALFVYDIRSQEFLQYNSIYIRNEYSVIFVIDARIFAEKVKRKSNEWHNAFISDIVERLRVDIDISLDKADEILLHYHFKLREFYIGEYIDISNFNDFASWHEGFLINRMRQKENEIEAMRLEFYRNWGVKPEENLFSRNFILPRENAINRARTISREDYNQNNVELNVLIEFYNSIINTHRGLSNIRMRGNIMSTLANNYNLVVRNISRLYNEFSIAKNAFCYKKILERFWGDVYDSLKLINPGEITINGFGLAFLRPCYLQYENNLPIFVLIYREVEDGIIGIYEEYIYVYRQRERSLYNIFTLERIDRI